MKLNKELSIIKKTLEAIHITLAKQGILLDNHISRTEVAEKRLDLLTGELTTFRQFMYRIQGGMGLLGSVSLIVGILWTLMRLMS